MDTSFWINKWQAGEIGFHLPQVHPLLEKFSQIILTQKQKILVPLCGKTTDMRYLAEQGHSVLGVELCDIAAKAFFAEQFQQNIEAKAVSEYFDSYAFNGIEIRVGDVFKLPQPLDGYSAIYDRAAIVALPLEMRKDYVKKLKQLCPTANMILITLDYDQSMMNGPPFSVDEIQVNQLFEFAQIEKLYQQDVIDNEPRFKAKGLKHFNQSLYHISW